MPSGASTAFPWQKTSSGCVPNPSAKTTPGRGSRACQRPRWGEFFPPTLPMSSTAAAAPEWLAPLISPASLCGRAAALTCWRGGAFCECRHDGGGTHGQDTGTVATTTAMQGPLEHGLGACRHAPLVTVRDQQCWVGTAGSLPAVPLCPWGGDPLCHHVDVLTTGTMPLVAGHGDRRYLA